MRRHGRIIGIKGKGRGRRRRRRWVSGMRSEARRMGMKFVSSCEKKRGFFLGGRTEDHVGADGGGPGASVKLRLVRDERVRGMQVENLDTV